ncbi:MAG: MarR family transcriptional regulator [Lachnospiraceae bacterium]|jgi:MarR family transcriptional repressor of mepA|nr:MarR family transcriptional regulator [Lachnospiraceae bacterium]
MEKHTHRFEDAPLGYQLKLINEKFTSKVNEQFRDDDLTFSQIGILFFLAKADRCGEGKDAAQRKPVEEGKDTAQGKPAGQTGVTQKELCEGMHVKHPTMIGLIGRMEEKGLIRQEVDKNDRRCRNIMLTGKGKSVLQKLGRVHERTNKYLTKGFTKEETRELSTLLARAYRNLEELQ